MIVNQISIEDAVGKEIKSVHNISDVNAITVITYSDGTFSALVPEEDYDNWVICDHSCVSSYIIHCLVDFGILTTEFENEFVEEQKRQLEQHEICILKRLQTKYGTLEV